MKNNLLLTLLLILLTPHLLLADEKHFNGESELTYKCGDEGYILITYKKNEINLDKYDSNETDVQFLGDL